MFPSPLGLSRLRFFRRGGLLAGGAAAGPLILRQSLLGAGAPSKKIVMGMSEKTDFIEAVKSRGQTLEDAEVGQRTTSLCHLAHIADQMGGARLTWDPERERFTDNDAANKLLERPALRAPWKLE